MQIVRSATFSSSILLALGSERLHVSVFLTTQILSTMTAFEKFVEKYKALGIAFDTANVSINGIEDDPSEREKHRMFIQKIDRKMTRIDGILAEIDKLIANEEKKG